MDGGFQLREKMFRDFLISDVTVTDCRLQHKNVAEVQWRGSGSGRERRARGSQLSTKSKPNNGH